MWKRQHYTLYKTENGFLRYLAQQRTEILSKFHAYESRDINYEYQLEEYMELRELALLDNEFFSLLEFGEKIAIDVVVEGKPLTGFGKKLFYQAQGKWIKTFFKEEFPYREIDPVALGIVLKNLREQHDYSKVKIASIIKFDRSYVGRVESGKMLPSFLYIYRFSKACDIKIDHIIELLDY